MRICAAGAVLLPLLLGGCSLLFDPDAVRAPAVVDAAVPPDLHTGGGHVDDLSVAPDAAEPEDLAVPADLADAAPPPPPDQQALADLKPCVPPLFVGFYDGGSVDPFDCRTCGCALDDFTDAARTAVRFEHNVTQAGTPPPITWTETEAAGALTLASADVPNGFANLLDSNGRAYLQGDFDLLVDYQVTTLSNGGFMQLLLAGPNNADLGHPDPYLVDYAYRASDGRMHFSHQIIADRSTDVTSDALSGTLALSRHGTTVCAGDVAQSPICRTGASLARVWLQLAAVTFNAACVQVCGAPAQPDCCPMQVTFRNLRLGDGALVKTP